MMSRRKYIRNIKKLCPELYNFCSYGDEFDGMTLIRLLNKIGHIFYAPHDNAIPSRTRGTYRRTMVLEFIRYNIERIEFELL